MSQHGACHNYYSIPSLNKTKFNLVNTHVQYCSLHGGKNGKGNMKKLENGQLDRFMIAYEKPWDPYQE